MLVGAARTVNASTDSRTQVARLALTPRKHGGQLISMGIKGTRHASQDTKNTEQKKMYREEEVVEMNQGGSRKCTPDSGNHKNTLQLQRQEAVCSGRNKMKGSRDDEEEEAWEDEKGGERGWRGRRGRRSS